MGINLTLRQTENGHAPLQSVSHFRVRPGEISRVEPNEAAGAALPVVPFCQFLEVSICTHWPPRGRGGIGRRRSLVGVVTTARDLFFFCKSLRFSSVSVQWGKTQSTCFQWRKKAQAYFHVAGARAHSAAPVGLLLNVENHCGRQLWCRWVWKCGEAHLAAIALIWFVRSLLARAGG